MQVEYLVNTENGSNKWYVAILLPQSNQSLTGHGPRQQGASGTWRRKDYVYGNRKLAEKLGNGYVISRLDDLPLGALSCLLDELSQMTGQKYQMSGGAIVPLGKAQPSAPAPRRGSNKPNINIWL